ncbi:hypothetical protein ES708_31677 [subsurface metagenome]
MENRSQTGLAHRNTTTHTPYNKPTLNNETLLSRLSYGVPTNKRMLSPSLLLKKHDLIRGYLLSLGLTAAEREIAFHLLRLFSYYGKVYPKASQFTEDGGCSKRSFWRAVAKLEELGIVDRIHRYLRHLQISNCYRLDKLVLCLIRYLAEHGHRFKQDFTRALLRESAPSFWRTIRTIRVRLKDDNPLTAMA